MEEGVVMMTGLAPQPVMRALAVLLDRDAAPRLPADYSVPDVSQKVVRLILSYTPYVREKIWRERA